MAQARGRLANEDSSTATLLVGSSVCPTRGEAPTLRSAYSCSTGVSRTASDGEGPTAAGARPPAVRRTTNGSRHARSQAGCFHRPLGPGSAFGACGRFEIVRLLGTGGMSSVFQARDRLLDRQVAAKFLRPEDSDVVQVRSLAEAQMIAKLDHENIVRVLDVGIWQGLAYLILEHHEGTVLSDVLDDGPLSAERATGILVEVARALDHIHRAGIIHLDLKPSNVFLCTHGGTKLLDFGISACRHSLRVTTSRMETEQSHCVGTPSYMAPEQWLMQEVDERTDLWGAGVLYHEMLFGTPPYGDHDPASARQFMLSQDDCAVASAGLGLPFLAVDLLQRLLRREPQDRIQSAVELLQALRRVIRHLRRQKRSVGGVWPSAARAQGRCSGRHNPVPR